MRLEVWRRKPRVKAGKGRVLKGASFRGSPERGHRDLEAVTQSLVLRASDHQLATRELKQKIASSHVPVHKYITDSCPSLQEHIED